MDNMQKYLMPKACPGRAQRALESAAMLVLFCLFAGCITLSIEAVFKDYAYTAVSWRNFLPLIPAVVLVLPMHRLGERFRARQRARTILKALLAAEGKIPAEEAEQVIGVHRAADTALALVERGYLQHVRLTQGFLCLEEAAAELDAQAPQEEIKPLFRD